MTNDEQLDQVRAEQAWEIVKQNGDQDAALIAARLAREGWLPPAPVDPDIQEARDRARSLFGGSFEISSFQMTQEAFYQAIKRGRALAAAEAKPGMVWVKHDGSKVCPIVGEVLARYDNGYFTANVAEYIHWPLVTHYAIITQPEDAVCARN